MKLSIIISNRNKEIYIEPCLRFGFKINFSNENYEVIVVSRQSGDEIINYFINNIFCRDILVKSNY